MSQIPILLKSFIKISLLESCVGLCQSSIGLTVKTRLGRLEAVFFSQFKYHLPIFTNLLYVPMDIGVIFKLQVELVNLFGLKGTLCSEGGSNNKPHIYSVGFVITNTKLLIFIFFYQFQY